MVFLQVLGLDESIKPAVLKMRRNLLKLINVGEFDSVANWQDPCISFTLPEVRSSSTLFLDLEPHRDVKDCVSYRYVLAQFYAFFNE